MIKEEFAVLMGEAYQQIRERHAFPDGFALPSGRMANEIVLNKRDERISFSKGSRILMVDGEFRNELMFREVSLRGDVIHHRFSGSWDWEVHGLQEEFWAQAYAIVVKEHPEAWTAGDVLKFGGTMRKLLGMLIVFCAVYPFVVLAFIRDRDLMPGPVRFWKHLFD